MPAFPDLLLLTATGLAAVAALMSARAASRSAAAADRNAEASERLAGPVLRLVDFGGPQAIGSEVLGPEEILLVGMNRGSVDARIVAVQIWRVGFDRVEDQLVFLSRDDPVVIPPHRQRGLTRVKRVENGMLPLSYGARLEDFDYLQHRVEVRVIGPVVRLYAWVLVALGRYEKTEKATPIIGRPFEGESGGRVYPPGFHRR